MCHDAPNTLVAKCGANCALLAKCTQRMHTPNHVPITFASKSQCAQVSESLQSPSIKKNLELVPKNAYFYPWTLGSAGWIRVLSLSDVTSYAPHPQMEQTELHNYFETCSFQCTPFFCRSKTVIACNVVELTS